MGPLKGLRIVEFGGIGPGPMAAMLLADLGADIIRIDRPSPSGLGIERPVRFNLMNRSRRSVAIDLKHEEGIAVVMSLLEKAEASMEGFRPGTMERLGLGPAECLQRNPRLCYARITGWGQDGPLAKSAGHDINYVSLSGVLHSIGRKGEPPGLPLSLTGDFGGGALYLAFGVVSAVLEARSSGQGQVVDVSMVEGSASLMTSVYGSFAAGMYSGERGTNFNDGGAYYWDTYRCSDGEYVSIAPLEKKFRAELLERIGVGDRAAAMDALPVEEARAVLREVFLTRTRDEWRTVLEGTDACFAPVLSLADAPNHPHNVARGTFIDVDGVVQPAPAPRFSRTVASRPTPPEAEGQSTLSALADWGIAPERLDRLWNEGVIGSDADRQRGPRI